MSKLTIKVEFEIESSAWAALNEYLAAKSVSHMHGDETFPATPADALALTVVKQADVVSGPRCPKCNGTDLSKQFCPSTPIYVGSSHIKTLPESMRTICRSCGFSQEAIIKPKGTRR